MSLVLSERFVNSADLIRESADSQKYISQVAFFARKLQISYYPTDVTPLDYERNVAHTRSLMRERCETLTTSYRWLYNNMNKKQRLFFSRRTINVALLLKKKGNEQGQDVFNEEKIGLLDSIMMYSKYCFEILDLDEDHFKARYNESIFDDKFGGSEELAYVKYQVSFSYIIVNEERIYDGMVHMISDLILSETGTSNTFQLVYILIPVLFSLCFVLNLCGCIVFTFQQRRTFRGLQLIPKEELQRMIRKLTGKYGSSSLTESNSKTLGTDLDSQESNHYDESNLSNLAKVDVVQLNLIQQFCCCSFIFLIVILLVFIGFTILGIDVCDKFVFRNNEYDHVLYIESHLNRLHKRTLELVHRNDSLFSFSDAVHSAEHDSERLLHYFDSVRFGGCGHGLRGMDHYDETHKIFYENDCDFTDDRYTKYQKVQCLSLTEKLETAASSAKRIINSIKRNGFANISLIRESSDYEKIVMIDNYSDDNNDDQGAAKEDLRKIAEFSEKKVDSELSLLRSISLLLVLFFAPAYLICYLRFFRKAYSRLNRNLVMVRSIMLLMKRQVIHSDVVYNYISKGDGGLFSIITKSRFSKLWEREKSNRMNLTYDILQMASYGFVFFTKDLHIVHYNTSSNELFRIKVINATNLAQIFSEESILQLKRWMRRNLKTSFNQEVTAIYEEQEYPVYADISRSSLTHKKQNNKKLYIGIFENMESTKKKDLLKDSERKSKRLDLIMRNILPKELAKSAKMEDFETGKCLIYQHKRATSYFMDIADFSGISAAVDPEIIINMLHRIFSNIDQICDTRGMEKIKTIGDCYFAVSGIPTYEPLHAVMAMEFAIDVIRMIDEYNREENPLLQKNTLNDDVDDELISKSFEIQIRTGLASGKLVAGVVGKTKRIYDVFGPCVNESARMESSGLPGKIQVSRGCYESLFSDYDFLEREIHLQGIGTSVMAYVHTPNLKEERINVLDVSNEERRSVKKKNEEIVKNEKKKKEEEEEEEGEGEGERCGDEEEQEEERKDVIDDAKKQTMLCTDPNECNNDESSGSFASTTAASPLSLDGSEVSIQPFSGSNTEDEDDDQTGVILKVVSGSVDVSRSEKGSNEVLHKETESCNNNEMKEVKEETEGTEIKEEKEVKNGEEKVIGFEEM